MKTENVLVMVCVVLTASFICGVCYMLYCIHVGWQGILHHSA